jgi:hypothetical protein
MAIIEPYFHPNSPNPWDEEEQVRLLIAKDRARIYKDVLDRVAKEFILPLSKKQRDTSCECRFCGTIFSTVPTRPEMHTEECYIGKLTDWIFSRVVQESTVNTLPRVIEDRELANTPVEVTF